MDLRMILLVYYATYASSLFARDLDETFHPAGNNSYKRTSHAVPLSSILDDFPYFEREAYAFINKSLEEAKEYNNNNIINKITDSDTYSKIYNRGLRNYFYLSYAKEIREIGSAMWSSLAEKFGVPIWAGRYKSGSNGWFYKSDYPEKNSITCYGVDTYLTGMKNFEIASSYDAATNVPYYNYGVNVYFDADEWKIVGDCYVIFNGKAYKSTFTRTLSNASFSAQYPIIAKDNLRYIKDGQFFEQVNFTDSSFVATQHEPLVDAFFEEQIKYEGILSPQTIERAINDKLVLAKIYYWYRQNILHVLDKVSDAYFQHFPKWKRASEMIEEVSNFLP